MHTSSSWLLAGDTIDPPAPCKHEPTRPAGGRAILPGVPGLPGHLVSQGTHEHVCQYPRRVGQVTASAVVGTLAHMVPRSQAIRTNSRLHRMRAVTDFSVDPSHGYPLRGCLGRSGGMWSLCVGVIMTRALPQHVTESVHVTWVTWVGVRRLERGCDMHHTETLLTSAARCATARTLSHTCSNATPHH
jgi:hypothetical protein